MNKRPNLYVDESQLTIGFTDGGETFLTIIDELVSRPESEVLLEQWGQAVKQALEQQITTEVQRLLRGLLARAFPQIVMSGTINYFGLDEPDTPDPDGSSIHRLMEGYEALWRLAGHDGAPSVYGAGAPGLRLVDPPGADEPPAPGEDPSN